jgi:putative DNA primase/helicase
MCLRTIVDVLGGDLYDRGFRANIPAPGHSPADRSVSLMLREGRIIVHTFGDGDWRTVLDHLRGHGLVDARNAPTSVSKDGPPAFGVIGASDRGAAGRRGGGSGRAVGRSPAQPVRATLPASPHRTRPARPRCGATSRRRRRCRPTVDDRLRRPPCSRASTDAAGAFTAVEVTYLAPNGRGLIDCACSRKTVGRGPAGRRRSDRSGGAGDAGGRGFLHHPLGQRVLRPARLGADVDPQPARLVGARGGAFRADRRRSRQGRRGLRRNPATPAGGSGGARQIALPPEPHGDWNEAARPA